MKRISVFVAIVAAVFLVAPAGQAFATAPVTINIEGSGSGEVSSSSGTEEENILPGEPPIECSYVSPGPATGICNDNASVAIETYEGIDVFSHPAAGSELLGWEASWSSTGEAFAPNCGFPIAGNCVVFEEGPGSLEEIQITAIICLEGQSEEECLTTPTFLLTVNTAGTGEGTVTSSPAGIECPSECEAEFEEGEEVELTATPETGSVFTGWSGNCTGTGSCKVTMSEAKEVTATFEPTPEFPLEIEIEGLGEGEVSCEVNGGSVEPCEAEYPEGTEVALVPEAETGSEFSGWGEDCTGTGPCELVMDEAHAVSATFEVEQVTLTVQVEGPGSVTGPEDIDCPGICGGNYSLGEEVELTATPDEGALFLEWTGPGAGACAGSSTPTCEVEMTADKTVKAIFALEPTPEFKLTIVKAGTGSGSVICNGGACAAEYPEGEEVTLAATAASGSTFSGWSGGGCSGTGSCKVTINADTTVTATFTANAKPEETCATNASLCPPPPPAVGTAKAAASASVKSGKASLKLTCSGGPCKGTLQLKAKVKQGKKTKNLVTGKASFSLADGATTTLKVKLSGPAKQELAKNKTLKVKVEGTDITASTVKLKQAKK
jgi:hypothetical protein